MKTAETIIDEIQQGVSMGPYEYLDYHDCVRAMKTYAEQAIKEVLSRAANTVPLGVLSSDKKREARSSILSTPYKDLLK